MKEIIPLTVCPNHCQDIFLVNAESLRYMLREEDSNVNLSELEVDSFGDPLDFTLELTACDLDGCRDWRCRNCGARPDLVDCISVNLLDRGCPGWLLIPLESRDYVYHDDGGETVRHIPFDIFYEGIAGFRYGGQEFYPLHAGETMDTSDMDEIETGYPQLRLFAKYPHVECKGQTSIF